MRSLDPTVLEKGEGGEIDHRLWYLFADSAMHMSCLFSSTLLRMIMSQEMPNKGLVQLGEHNIVPNYFQQNQAEALDLNLSVIVSTRVFCIEPI